MDNEYSFGNCNSCGKFLPLKGGKCLECSMKKSETDLPDFMKEMFEEFDGDKNE